MVHPLRTLLYELFVTEAFVAAGLTILLAMPASVCVLEANRVVFAHSRAFSHVFLILATLKVHV